MTEQSDLIPAPTSPTTPSSSLTDDDQWTTGDFTLVSADNVVFRVDCFYLYAASGVFRDARAITNPPLRFEFTDMDIENASVLRYFLALVVHGKIITVWNNGLTSYGDLVPLTKLVRFLLKYSCEVHLDLLNSKLLSKLQARNGRMLAFVIAAVQDDSAWCSKLLKEEKERVKWKMDSQTHAHEVGQNHKMLLDPSGAPFWFLSNLPTPYLWALCRAWGAVPDGKQGVDRAKEFEEFLKDLKRNGAAGTATTNC